MTIEQAFPPKLSDKTQHFFGRRKSDGAAIYLSVPSWECGWYWSFGYLGNTKEHYHLSSYQQKDIQVNIDGKFKLLSVKRNKSMYDCLLADYDLAKPIKNNLWIFCELVQSVYTLKKVAELYAIGSSNITTNPCVDLLKSPTAAAKINKVVLPALFAELIAILEGSK